MFSHFLSFFYFKSVQSLTLGVPYFTTNQQHGIPCFINEDPPDWPVWTRECVVEGPALKAMAKTKAEKKERKKAKALAEAKKDLLKANGLTPPSLRPHDGYPGGYCTVPVGTAAVPVLWVLPLGTAGYCGYCGYCRS